MTTLPNHDDMINWNGSVTQEFVARFENTLNQNLEGLERSIQQHTTKNVAMKSKIKNRCIEMKETKKKITSWKDEGQEMQKTLECLLQSKKELSEYNNMLEADAETHEQENIALAKNQQLKLKNAEAKWKCFKAKYETLPLAIARNGEEVALRKTKIQLMEKEYQLLEMKNAIATRKKIDKKRRNNLVVECTQLYKEAEIENIKMRVTLETQKNLQEELCQQEITITELKKKLSERLATSMQSVTEKSDQKRISLPMMSQRHLRTPIFDLSALVGPLAQAMPFSRKDYYDTISITSSVIDNLTQPEKFPPIETNDPVPSKSVYLQDDDQTSNAPCFLGSTSKTNTNVENRQVPSDNEEKITSASNLRSKNPENAKKGFERSDVESTVGEHSNQHQTEEYNSSKKVEASDSAENCPDVDEEAVRFEYAAISDTAREKSRQKFEPESKLEQQRELGEPASKHPRIMTIEKVQLKLPPHTPITAKPSQDDSLAHYFGASGLSSEFNWKPNYPPSFFSNPDSRRDVDLESIPESDRASLQSEDIMKQFHVTFSPERTDRKEYATSVDDNRANGSPQTIGGPYKIGQTQAASQFLDTRKSTTRSAGNGNKREPFFLSLF